MRDGGLGEIRGREGRGDEGVCGAISRGQDEEVNEGIGCGLQRFCRRIS